MLLLLLMLMMLMSDTQLEPRRAMWPWLNAPGHRNDFFQYATHEVLGVGGAGHWAIHLDQDLIHGSSGPCDTFGSPCLVSELLQPWFGFLEKFRVAIGCSSDND
jgi:hypothetical protein